MKKYIKSLAILLTLSLGFAACSEDEVEQVTYASAEEIASWASETTGSKDTLYNYNISLYVNQEGDTLCTFTRIDKKTGNEKYLRRGVISYDKLAGMTTVVFPPRRLSDHQKYEGSSLSCPPPRHEPHDCAALQGVQRKQRSHDQ